MGFLFFCGLVWLVAVTAWAAFKSRDERAKLLAEFREKPWQNLFVLVWVASIFVFVIGVFGGSATGWEPEFFDTGLTVWQVGGLTALAGLLISLFCRF